MTKREFLTALELGLMGLPEEDRRRSLEYYSEMIDDRIDDGVAEEEAVKAVGSLEEIVKELRGGAPIREEKGSAPGRVTYNVEEDFHSIRVDTTSADVTLALSDSGSCCVVCDETEEVKFSVGVENGTLAVKRLPQSGRRRWFKNILFVSGDTRVTVHLPREQFDALKVHTVSGDVEVPEDFRFGTAKIETSSGDVAFAADVDGELSIDTVSGDVELENVRAGRIHGETSSGDVKVTAVAGALSIDTVSGDVELEDVQAGTIHGETTSGDIKLKRCDADSLKLSSVSGDIGGTLLSGKRFNVHTVSGDRDVPATDGGPCEISTVSGDIDIQIAK